MNNEFESKNNQAGEDSSTHIEENKINEKKDQNIQKNINKTNKLTSTKKLDKKVQPSKDNNHHNIVIDLKEEIESLRDEKLRILAEMENLRKRSEKDKIDSIKYGSANLARDILSPSDNLSRALESVLTDDKAPTSIKNLIDGLKMVQKEFMTILEKHGVEKIEAMNKKFDHNYHQAMLEIETDNCEQGIVVQEIQSGFMMHDRLLRPSMVGVSKKTEIRKKSKKKE